jgi:hypothetical protein
MVTINTKNIMKKIILFAGIVAAMLTTACRDEIDTVYQEGERIYFEYEYQDPFYALPRMIKRDSLVVSMGKLPTGQNAYELSLPVKVLGYPLSSDRQYGVRTITEGTVVSGTATAQLNVHYQPIAATQTFHAGLWTDTLRITLLRSSLSSSFSRREQKTLLLQLVETDELKLGLRDGWELKIVMNNYIDEPEWWNVYALGYYHPEKYKVLLMFESEAFYASVDIMNGASRYISALRSYLRDNIIIDEETGKRVGFDSLLDL